MKSLQCRRIVASVFLAGMCCLNGMTQTGTDAKTPATVPNPVLPATTQIKKTVVFLEADCLHDFEPEIKRLTPELLGKMTPEQVLAEKQQLILQILRLRPIKQSIAKLSLEEINMVLKPDVLSSLELPQLGNLIVKMSSLTTDDIEKMIPQERAILPRDSHMGTGFVVALKDERLPVPAGTDPSQTGFGYLITNRHVVQPGIEDGKPCPVITDYVLLLNRKSNSTDNVPKAEPISLGPIVPWHFSSDDSVDLAVVLFLPSPEIYDFIRIPLDFFTTDEMVQKRLVVEGDPLLFSGLFIQSFMSVHTLEPIVRFGTLAMIPSGLLETTLRKPGKIYLAEAHAFGGNSGSPVFVDTNRFANIITPNPNYKLLGVISGEVLERSDLTLQITTSYTANVGANSDVSVVVPAIEIKKILDSSPLQAERDAYVARLPRTK